MSTKVLVVWHYSSDSGQRLIGVVTSADAAILLITKNFTETMDSETFEVLTDDESTMITVEGGVLTTCYPIVEHGEDVNSSEDCYLVQYTWLY